MANIRSVNEIIQNLIDFYRLALPDADVKPGTIVRDLFIDGPASQLALLYDTVSSISTRQSFILTVGSDLDKLAKNFGLTRKQATPSSGVALLTFSSINAPININRNDLVISNNGFSFKVSNGISVTPAGSNFYRSVASKFRDQLDFAGISDEFAVEVTVIATTSGTAGNIGTFSLNRTTIAGVSNVTNVKAFLGGTDQESDSAFRNRILSSFSGSSVGTALGYLNAALSVAGVSDAAVIEPGDPLMTRDGTQVIINADGSRTIISEGTGGKVDVVVLGSNLIQNSESFIFQDKSNNNDPTNSKNDIVLGQIIADLNKTINRKRIDDIKNGEFPSQPVDNFTGATGSLSGANFKEKSIDSLGRIFGNFELIKDTGDFAGSPWGFDKFHWISDRISLFSEDRVKGQPGGQDPTTFTDILEIHSAQQNVIITNENSLVTSDRSIIQLLHTPATNVTRVLNVNTGERYIITNQNLDNTGNFNQTGRIQISGNTLPSTSDVLQVDYTWVVDYDQYMDFDGLKNTENPRKVTDSIDWGLSSVIKNEIISFVRSGNFFTGTASFPINTIINANTFLEVDGYVETVSSGIYANRLSVTIKHLANPPTSVNSITLKNNNSELYTTASNDGVFSSVFEVIGINLLYVTTIILPTDTIAKEGNRITVFLNYQNVFVSGTTSGTSNGTQITIPVSLINTTANTINLKVNYITSISDLFSSAITTLPTSRIGNGFILSNNNGFNNFSIVNISRREHQTVQKNLSNQFFVELSLSSAEYKLLSSQIILAIRLSDGAELWNSDNLGSISVGTSGNFQLIFNGLNVPATGDKVLIIYFATDSNRAQPFSFANNLIKVRKEILSQDAAGKLSVPINNITSQPSAVNFSIFEPNTDINYFSVTDGVLTAVSSSLATLTSTTDFSTLPDLINKKIKIVGAVNSNNSGVYDIIGYDSATNTLSISNILDNLTADQITVIRIADGKEVWNYSGNINVIGNDLLMPANLANPNDTVIVFFFNFNNLRQSSTRLISNTIDQIINPGVITIFGTTLSKVTDIIFTATSTGLHLNLLEAIRKSLNLNSAASIPTNLKIAKLAKLEKVITASAGSDEVLETIVNYDVKDTIIQNNLLFSNDMLLDNTLPNLDFILPSTLNNSSNTSDNPNLPKIGDKLRVTFYYTTENDSENLSYTRNGILYTNKKFALINKIFAASGFKSSQSTRLTVSSFNQPNTGSRYKAFYDYLAPKANERIVLTYNFNKIISDVTFSIESTRPINADVLVKEANLISLDLTMNVVIADSFKSSTTTILQTLRDKLTTALTTTTLGQVVDTIDLINIAQGINGIARARILHFNKAGASGQVLSIQAQKNEFFAPNNIIINTESR